MSDSFKNREIVAELVESFCQNDITPEKVSQLDELLRTDKDARCYYLRYLHMHASLRQLFACKPEEEGRVCLKTFLNRVDAESALGDFEDRSAPLSPPLELLNEEIDADQLTLPLLGSLGYAAKQCGSMFTNPFHLGVLMVLVVAAYLSGGYRLVDLTPNPLLATQVPVQAPAQIPAQVQAVVVKTPAATVAARYIHGVDTVWSKGVMAPEVGDPLVAGSLLHLERGVAEIAFDCGAKVFLNGPARFTVISPMAGTLDFGQLTTDVPEEARGFLVETPQASIVDQGTSVSVSVDQDGNSEAFVHEGEVLVGIEDVESLKDGKRAIKRLIKGEGVRIEASLDGSPVVYDITAPPDQLFVPKLETLPPDTPRRIAGLRLWLSADMGVFRDVEGTVPAEPGDPVARWVDQSGNNLSPLQHVLYRRPQLVVNTHGKRSLRFDGVDRQRLEEPSSVGPTSLVLDASDRGRPQFTICMVFKTEGPPRFFYE